MDKFFEIGMLILGSIYALSHLLRTIYLFKDDDELIKLLRKLVVVFNFEKIHCMSKVEVTTPPISKIKSI